MEDRIVFPTELIEEAGKRLKRIARSLDDLSRMLSAAEKSVDLNTLKKSSVLDELTRYEKRLLLASEEAMRLSRALDRAWEDFLRCEQSTKRDFLQIEAAVFEALEGKNGRESGKGEHPFS